MHHGTYRCLQPLVVCHEGRRTGRGPACRHLGAHPRSRQLTRRCRRQQRRVAAAHGLVHTAPPHRTRRHRAAIRVDAPRVGLLPPCPKVSPARQPPQRLDDIRFFLGLLPARPTTPKRLLAVDLKHAVGHGRGRLAVHIFPEGSVGDDGTGLHGLQPLNVQRRVREEPPHVIKHHRRFTAAREPEDVRQAAHPGRRVGRWVSELAGGSVGR